LKPKPVELRLEPVDNKRLSNLCGALDENLRQIETALDISIARRGERFSLRGNPAQADLGALLLERFYNDARRPLSLDDIQLGLVEFRRQSHATADTKARVADSLPGDEPPLATRRSDLRGRTPRQREYIRNILDHDITFAIGPAGTGKTYLAVACAADALERDTVKRIVLVRPAVEAGERLGFLPGDLAQKVDPYLRPLYDALYDLLGFDKVQKLLERSAIELAPLAYMRGRTLNHAFVILDEAQNTTPEQMKMFLTRMGFGSKSVITGDVTQVDLPRGARSGLAEAREVLKDVRGIAFTTFLSEDVVRHPLVQRIVDAYDTKNSN
jgi:phosphate starvation-inducible PhoH-like protein